MTDSIRKLAEQAEDFMSTWGPEPIVPGDSWDRDLAIRFAAEFASHLQPQAPVCPNEEIGKRDDLLSAWCDSWNDLTLREKRDSIQSELFDKTNAIWPTGWPPIEQACKNCHDAYGRGWEKADESLHEYLDRKGASPANGRGLFLRLDELFALSAAKAEPQAPSEREGKTSK